LEFLVFNNLWRGSCIAAWFALALVSASCGGAGSAPFDGDSLSPVTIGVSPQSMTIATGTTQVFTATVDNTSMTSVSWMVNGIAGGDSSLGTIDKTGNYTAPPYVPIPPKVTITAVANADSSKTANASVSISGPSAPGSVTISPTSSSLYVGGIALFTVTVNDANKAVSWLVNGIEGGDPGSVGTISQVPGSEDQAVYVAPVQVFGAGQVTVTAVSIANPTQAASAVVTMSLPPPHGAKVTITDPQTAPTVPTGQTQPFQASVTGVTDTSVSWEVDGIRGGNANVGTIAPGANDTATYTAPARLPDPPQVIVTAFSNAQTAASASIGVNLIAAQQVTVSVSAENCANPNAVPVSATVQFTASLTGTPDQEVTWQVNQIDGGNDTVGTISAAGIYTAPATIPNPAAVTVAAVSNAEPSAKGNESVTITLAPVLQVTISPLTASVAVGEGQQFDATVLVTGGTTNLEVSWLVNGQLNGGDGTYGTISGGNPDSCVTEANYVAPGNIPNPGVFPVTAVSVADPTKSASATVTLTPPQNVVTVSPTNASVQTGAQQQFNASVSNTNDQLVYWSLSYQGQSCASSVCGMIDSSGLYTAPANVPTPPDVTVIATADVNHSAIGTATVTIVQGAPSLTIFPSSHTLAAGSAPYSFQAIITNAPPNTNVSWQLGCISLWDGDSGENCNDSDFDSDGPGCIQINGFKVCGNRPDDGPGNDPLTYTPPKKLFTNTFAPNVCELQNNGSGDGMVPLTATINVQGCSQGTCTATACITITPP
jgi:hypothetical protein